ncbi:MAG: hypothetical protein IJJ82_06845 [Clostridia bacterium]|nr:hypothetical protein [Clostridia bacterium]
MQKVMIKIDKNQLKKIFNKLFNKKVLKFTYLGKCRLNKMMEYNFVLYEFNVMLEDFTNYTVFIKTITGDDVKQSLFCYWQFCEENYNIHGKFYLNKASIKSENINQYPNCVQKYTLQLLSKNNKIWKASDIDIIDLKKLKEEMKDEKQMKNLHQREKIDYKYNTKEYLFIGII